MASWHGFEQQDTQYICASGLVLQGCKPNATMIDTEVPLSLPPPPTPIPLAGIPPLAAAPLLATVPPLPAMPRASEPEPEPKATTVPSSTSTAPELGAPPPKEVRPSALGGLCPTSSCQPVGGRLDNALRLRCPGLLKLGFISFGCFLRGCIESQPTLLPTYFLESPCSDD